MPPITTSLPSTCTWAVAVVTPPSPSLTRSLTVVVPLKPVGLNTGFVPDFVSAGCAAAGLAEDVVAVEVPLERKRIERPGRVGRRAVQRDRRIVEREIRAACVGRSGPR